MPAEQHQFDLRASAYENSRPMFLTEKQQLEISVADDVIQTKLSKNEEQGADVIHNSSEVPESGKSASNE